MRNHFRLLLLFIFGPFLPAYMLYSCHHEPDPIIEPIASDARRIEGRTWEDLIGFLHKDWHYHFDRGILTQRYIKAGAVITTLQFPYAIRQDSLLIGGNQTNSPRLWILSFECDEIVNVKESGSLIGGNFWLKKE